jgi:hypothetical protein
MSDTQRVRFEIGFEGGQSIAGFADAASVESLERALHEDGPRVIVLETDDGPCHVVVPQVAFLRRSSRVSRVGFATG